MHWPLGKIISGGQTGADRAGLIAGWQLGYPTGGAVPRGCRTENGADRSLVDQFGCHESVSSRYDVRTLDNIMASTGTVIFGQIAETGSSLTLNLCRTWRPEKWLVNPTAEELRRWVVDQSIGILNAAGNRESKNPGIYARVVALLTTALVRP